MVENNNKVKMKKVATHKVLYATHKGNYEK
jgi:effector-binding domain-containing protein